jgi:hypothetical protein
MIARGDRVQAHPATDAWARGDRYGSVESIGQRWVHVRMDRSGRILRFSPLDLIYLETVPRVWGLDSGSIQHVRNPAYQEGTRA